MGKANHKKKMTERLREQKGESLIETMASVLIMSLGFTMLAGAIVSSARVNATARDMTTMAQETLKEDDWTIENTNGLSSTNGSTIEVEISYESSGTNYTKDVSPVLMRYGGKGNGVYVFQ